MTYDRESVHCGAAGMNPIEELQALQAARGYLIEDDLRALSDRSGIPLYSLEAIASFYPHFRRTQPTAIRVGVCRDLSCHLRDGGAAMRALAALCEKRADIEFEEISCPGLCDRAPACLLDGSPASPEDVTERLANGVSPASDAPDTPAPRRKWETDPYAGRDETYGELRRVVAAQDWGGVLTCISESGLRGMGGAGFPTGRKWEMVRKEAAAQKYVVCNADESEPGAFKDRVILEELPHLVIEGMALAGLTVGADCGIIYVRHEYGAATAAIRTAIDDAYARGVLGPDVCGSGLRFDLRIFVSPGGYILGEETALLEALEGRRGEPRNKPPFPGAVGLYGKPTLINNVETLAHVPRILRTGEANLKFFSVSGDVREPGVIEAPLGITLEALVARAGGLREGKALLAFLPGGASTGFLPAARADVAMSWEALSEANSALGAGAVVVIGEGANLLDLGRNLTAFFRNESCGKCVPCRIGTEKAVRLIDTGTAESLAVLPSLDETLRATSICGLGQVALTPVMSVLEQFPSHAPDAAPAAKTAETP
jgi:NADH:ubiquinone oxidoreductase subunit F (NADH-binding)/NADH:ubiquinone oxidoreductase subunit E